MTIHKSEYSLTERTRLLINGVEIKFSDLVYSSCGNNRVRGFYVGIEVKRMNRHLGNVEFIQLFLDNKIIAMGWVIVDQHNMHYWDFDEVVSYSPWWPDIKKIGQVVCKEQGE